MQSKLTDENNWQLVSTEQMKTFDVTDFYPIFCYNNNLDFDEIKSVFLHFITNFKYKGAKTMYRSIGRLLHSFHEFNQPMGFHMN